VPDIPPLLDAEAAWRLVSFRSAIPAGSTGRTRMPHAAAPAYFIKRPLRDVCYFGKMAGSGRCCRLKQPDARQAGSDRRGHELQVAMKKLGSIEADQQARLAHMLTRKGGKEITKALSDGALLRCHLCIGVVSNDRH
jgi:hypothetical protein